jgi:hypothetical protein
VLLDEIKGTSEQDCYSKTNQGFFASFDPAGIGRLLQIAINTDRASHRFSVQTPSNFAYDANDLYDNDRPSGQKCLLADAEDGCDQVSKFDDLAVINHTPEYYAYIQPGIESCKDNTSAIMRICGASSKENVFYFTKTLSQYLISGAPPGSPQVPCTYTNCYISRKDGGFLSTKFQTGWFSNVDLLVFPDKQIRPTS